MDNKIIRQVQFVQLDIAKQFDRLCRKNGLNYFMIGGTLLGAVRHKGFIPWDDDVDLGMLRADYERFINLAKKGGLPKGLVLQDWNTDPAYGLMLCKIRKQGTKYIEQNSKAVNLKYQVYILMFSLLIIYLIQKSVGIFKTR